MKENNKNRKKMKHLYLTLGLLTALLSVRCGKDSSDPFMEFDAYDAQLSQRIEAYQDQTFPNPANTKTGNASMYIDFSSGIFQAFKNNPANSNLIKAVYGNLSGDLDVFKLNNNAIQPLENSNSDVVGRMVVEENQYHGIYAPIKEAVSQIVSKNNDALLVTDFEEYYPASSGRAEITDLPYLKEYFIKWLEKGNSIRFYISNYKENGIEKHLYFTVFNCGNSSNGMIKKVENTLGTLPYYDLANPAFQLSQGYASDQKGGIFYDAEGKDDKTKNVLDLNKEAYKNGLEANKYFEFYPFNLDWNTIGKLKESYQEQGLFKEFFRKLFVDLSNEDAYSNVEIEVKVNDVTEDFEHFSKCKEATNHKPKLAKGNNGEDKFDDKETDNIALQCYESNGKLKEEWIYKSKPAVAIHDFFNLNKELFANTKKTDAKKTELSIAFDPKFSVKNLSNPQGLTRVDIIIKNAEPNASNSKLEFFKWASTTKKGSQNLALYESIKNTLTDSKVKPNGKTIYSYYIKTLQ